MFHRRFAPRRHESSDERLCCPLCVQCTAGSFIYFEMPLRKVECAKSMLINVEEDPIRRSFSHALSGDRPAPANCIPNSLAIAREPISLFAQRRGTLEVQFTSQYIVFDLRLVRFVPGMSQNCARILWTS